MRSVPHHLIEVLCDGLKKNASWRSRKEASKALGRLGHLPNIAIEALETALADQDDEVRFSVACVLSQYPHHSVSRTEQALLDFLDARCEGQYWSDCISAIKALARLGSNSERCRTMLRRCVSASDEDLKSLAEQTLRQLREH